MEWNLMIDSDLALQTFAVCQRFVENSGAKSISVLSLVG